MSRLGCNPAVTAGLIAASISMVPQPAYAVDFPGARMGAGSELLFAFLFGCAAGVTATFVARVVHAQEAQAHAGARFRDVRHAADVRQAKAVPLQSEAPLPEQPYEVLVAEPEPSTPATTQSTKPFTPEQFAQAAAESKARAERRAAGPAHMDPSLSSRHTRAARRPAVRAAWSAQRATLVDLPDATPRVQELDPWAARRAATVDELSGGLFVVPDTVTSEQVEERAAKHFGPSDSGEIVFSTVVAAPDENDIESAAPSSAYYSSLYTNLINSQDAPVPPEKTSAPSRPNDTASREAYRVYNEAFASQVSSEYERVATEYAQDKRKKVSAMERLRGVKALLQDRLGTSMMDGVPVISRADGTVGDVGTTWWNDNVGERVVSADAEVQTSMPTVIDVGTQEFARNTARIAARISLLDQAQAASADASPASAQHDGPAQDHEAYRGKHFKVATETPDPRGALWRVALEELDGAAQQVESEPVAVFDVSEALQTADIDEPDGLEGTTNIIPFVAVGGHPEVVDTSSYVDYLIEDEFAKSGLKAARDEAKSGSVRDRLRVMKGGTAGWRAGDPDDAQGGYEEMEWLEAKEA